MFDTRFVLRSLFIAVILILFLMTIQACAKNTTIPESNYVDIDQHSTQDYRIMLKNGTKYNASRIAVTDSILTILAIANSDGTKSQRKIADDLPYSILIEEKIGCHITGVLPSPLVTLAAGAPGAPSSLNMAGALS